ncbi:hypothetical protein L1D42_18450, partial [Photobacterium damselae]|nr:hypothetical protein [Photobacterium damselae]
MKANRSVFIESGLGFGLYDFISSLINKESKNIKFIKIDLSDVISKNQIDDKVKSDTGHNIKSLILLLSSNED